MAHAVNRDTLAAKWIKPVTSDSPTTDANHKIMRAPPLSTTGLVLMQSVAAQVDKSGGGDTLPESILFPLLSLKTLNEEAAAGPEPRPEA